MATALPPSHGVSSSSSSQQQVKQLKIVEKADAKSDREAARALRKDELLSRARMLGIAEESLLQDGLGESGDWKLFKTTICKFALQGKCTKGAECRFAHHISELRQKPDLKKTRLCYKWLCGQCQDSTCKYAHGEMELQTKKDPDGAVLPVSSAKGHAQGVSVTHPISAVAGGLVVACQANRAECSQSGASNSSGDEGPRRATHHGQLQEVESSGSECHLRRPRFSQQQHQTSPSTSSTKRGGVDRYGGGGLTDFSSSSDDERQRHRTIAHPSELASPRSSSLYKKTVSPSLNMAAVFHGQQQQGGTPQCASPPRPALGGGEAYPSRLSLPDPQGSPAEAVPSLQPMVPPPGSPGASQMASSDPPLKHRARKGWQQQANANANAGSGMETGCSTGGEETGGTAPSSGHVDSSTSEGTCGEGEGGSCCRCACSSCVHQGKGAGGSITRVKATSAFQHPAPPTQPTHAHSHSHSPPLPPPQHRRHTSSPSLREGVGQPFLSPTPTEPLSETCTPPQEQAGSVSGGEGPNGKVSASSAPILSGKELWAVLEPGETQGASPSQQAPQAVKPHPVADSCSDGSGYTQCKAPPGFSHAGVPPPSHPHPQSHRGGTEELLSLPPRPATGKLPLTGGTGRIAPPPGFEGACPQERASASGDESSGTGLVIRQQQQQQQQRQPGGGTGPPSLVGAPSSALRERNSLSEGEADREGQMGRRGGEWQASNASNVRFLSPSHSSQHQQQPPQQQASQSPAAACSIHPSSAPPGHPPPQPPPHAGQQMFQCKPALQSTPLAHGPGGHFYHPSQPQPPPPDSRRQQPSLMQQPHMPPPPHAHAAAAAGSTSSSVPRSLPPTHSLGSSSSLERGGEAVGMVSGRPLLPSPAVSATGFPSSSSVAAAAVAAASSSMLHLSQTTTDETMSGHLIPPTVPPPHEHTRVTPLPSMPPTSQQSHLPPGLLHPHETKGQPSPSAACVEDETTELDVPSSAAAQALVGGDAASGWHCDYRNVAVDSFGEAHENRCWRAGEEAHSHPSTSANEGVYDLDASRRKGRDRWSPSTHESSAGLLDFPPQHTQSHMSSHQQQQQHGDLLHLPPSPARPCAPASSSGFAAASGRVGLLHGTSGSGGIWDPVSAFVRRCEEEAFGPTGPSPQVSAGSQQQQQSGGPSGAASSLLPSPAEATAAPLSRGSQAVSVRGAASSSYDPAADTELVRPCDPFAGDPVPGQSGDPSPPPGYEGIASASAGRLQQQQSHHHHQQQQSQKGLLTLGQACLQGRRHDLAHLALQGHFPPALSSGGGSVDGTVSPLHNQAEDPPQWDRERVPTALHLLSHVQSGGTEGPSLGVSGLSVDRDRDHSDRDRERELSSVLWGLRHVFENEHDEEDHDPTPKGPTQPSQLSQTPAQQQQQGNNSAAAHLQAQQQQQASSTAQSYLDEIASDAAEEQVHERQRRLRSRESQSAEQQHPHLPASSSTVAGAGGEDLSLPPGLAAASAACEERERASADGTREAPPLCLSRENLRKLRHSLSSRNKDERERERDRRAPTTVPLPSSPPVAVSVTQPPKLTDDWSPLTVRRLAGAAEAEAAAAAAAAQPPPPGLGAPRRDSSGGEKSASEDGGYGDETETDGELRHYSAGTVASTSTRHSTLRSKPAEGLPVSVGNRKTIGQSHRKTILGGWPEEPSEDLTDADTLESGDNILSSNAITPCIPAPHSLSSSPTAKELMCLVRVGGEFQVYPLSALTWCKNSILAGIFSAAPGGGKSEREKKHGAHGQSHRLGLQHPELCLSYANFNLSVDAEWFRVVMNFVMNNKMKPSLDAHSKTQQQSSQGQQQGGQKGHVHSHGGGSSSSGTSTSTSTGGGGPSGSSQSASAVHVHGSGSSSSCKQGSPAGSLSSRIMPSSSHGGHSSSGGNGAGASSGDDLGPSSHSESSSSGRGRNEAGAHHNNNNKRHHERTSPKQLQCRGRGTGGEGHERKTSTPPSGGSGGGDGEGEGDTEVEGESSGSSPSCNGSTDSSCEGCKKSVAAVRGEIENVLEALALCQSLDSLEIAKDYVRRSAWRRCCRSSECSTSSSQEGAEEGGEVFSIADSDLAALFEELFKDSGANASAMFSASSSSSSSSSSFSSSSSSSSSSCSSSSSSSSESSSTTAVAPVPSSLSLPSSSSSSRLSATSSIPAWVFQPSPHYPHPSLLSPPSLFCMI
uniref:C3H1-type domain-containing protein n=1 Tax=Chromera velia CCMP2878 TaxID=1169474 RepID=A0A0G4HPE5_9ALVE|eukprot:Cvel_7828.t1-p1 / transcript=Cvel_7828.t1 / gene=Cvel_7828 / organism=Chromera_velia_CCMP2878 / gene_product=hypothetical protein / transcript_product=hypothetical protein / location=Cvel_scaffold418:25506-48774(+) / protein_length=2184 / sequence_SO=supercontig / SO=protein_coding / is_pseudo=false